MMDDVNRKDRRVCGRPLKELPVHANWFANLRRVEDDIARKMREVEMGKANRATNHSRRHQQRPQAELGALDDSGPRAPTESNQTAHRPRDSVSHRSQIAQEK